MENKLEKFKKDIEDLFVAYFEDVNWEEGGFYGDVHSYYLDNADEIEKYREELDKFVDKLLKDNNFHEYKVVISNVDTSYFEVKADNIEQARSIIDECMYQYEVPDFSTCDRLLNLSMELEESIDIEDMTDV